MGGNRQSADIWQHAKGYTARVFQKTDYELAESYRV